MTIQCHRNDFEGAVASYAANLVATGPWNGEVPPKVVKRLEARKVVSVPTMLWFLFFTKQTHQTTPQLISYTIMPTAADSAAAPRAAALARARHPAWRGAKEAPPCGELATLPDARWICLEQSSQAGGLVPARRKPLVAARGGELYLLGGEDTGSFMTFLTDLWVRPLTSGGRWRRLPVPPPPLRMPLQAPQGLFVGDELWLFGAAGTVLACSLHAASPAAAWRTIVGFDPSVQPTQRPLNRLGFSLAALGGAV